METGSASLACQREEGRAGGGSGPSRKSSHGALSPQSNRASPTTGRPPSRRHRSEHLGASGDGWRVCPKPCTPGPRRRPWPAPHSAGTPPACEVQGRAGVHMHCPPRPEDLTAQQGAGQGSGPLRALPAMGGPGSGGPFSSQAPVRLRPIRELQSHLSEDTSMSSSRPFIARATAQRQQRDSKTLLGSHSILDQTGKSPCSWSQKLVSACGPPATWRTCLVGGRGASYTLGQGVGSGAGLPGSGPSSALAHCLPRLFPRL